MRGYRSVPDSGTDFVVFGASDMGKWGFWLTVLLLAMGGLVGCGGRPEQSQNRSRLDIVKSRGKLFCGVSGELPGFSYLDPAGNYSGLDVDVCRAIAAAIFDDPEAVEFRKLNAKERFIAVQTGKVDVLSRNTTWTLDRDTTGGLEFAPTVFYDGQGIMVRKSSNIETLEDLSNKTICTQTGTTNELNLADQMRKREIEYKPLVYEDVNITYNTYFEGRCDAVTSDRSQLVSRRSAFPNPEEHVVLEDVLSKEPLGPATRNGDSRWFDVVKWSVYTLIEAEELGITSENLDKKLASNDPVVARFLGQSGELGQGLGLSNDFAVRIIRHVGNYGEVYDRSLGPESSLDLPRGLNQLWTAGGLLYSPPFR